MAASETANASSNDTSALNATQLLERLNNLAAKSGNNISETAVNASAYKKAALALSDIGARSARGLGELPSDDKGISALAKSIVQSDSQAQKAAADMRQNRSSIGWGVTKASGSTLTGAAKGAAVAGVLAVATRPLAWLANKVTGDRTKTLFSMTNIITLGAMFYGAKSLGASLNNSYRKPLMHNRESGTVAEDAVALGIRREIARRARTQTQGGPATPNQEPPSTGPGGPGTGPQGPRDGSPGPTGEGMQMGDKGSKPADHSATVAEIARNAGVAGRTRELVTGMEDVKIVEPPPKDEVGPTVVAQR